MRVPPRRGIGIYTPERVTLTFLTFSNQRPNYMTHGSRDPNMSRVGARDLIGFTITNILKLLEWAICLKPNKH